MVTQNIKNKIKELFESTPDTVVGVAFGHKLKGGKLTGEHSIIFSVRKKLPINELEVKDVLPKNIVIDGVTYKTDIQQVGEIKAITCDPSCYTWQSSQTGNESMVRPLRGGLSITAQNTAIYHNGSLDEWFVGTMGLIAVDVNTQALVGVTNNHVVVQDAFIATDRYLNRSIEAEVSNYIYQDGESGPGDPNKLIGQVVRYEPITLVDYNFVDAALFSLDPSVISMTSSYYIYGLTGQPGALPFATTQEIDNLLVDNPLIYSSGRTTGVKQGICSLAVASISDTILVSGYQLQGNTQSVTYTDLIRFTRQDPSCTDPIYSGDSGSALIADYGNGVWKIIGLCFAGDDSTNGWACRIDQVASYLSIEAWDGTTKNFIDPSTITYITATGPSNQRYIDVNGQNYWQIGLTTSSISWPVNTSTTTTTTTSASPVQYILFNQSSNPAGLRTLDVNYMIISTQSNVNPGSFGTTSCTSITDRLQAYGVVTDSYIDVYAVESGLGNLIQTNFDLGTSDNAQFNGQSDFIITDTGVPVSYYEYDLYNQSSNPIGLRTVDSNYQTVSTQSSVSAGSTGSIYTIYSTYAIQTYGLVNGTYVDVYSYNGITANLLSSNYPVNFGYSISTGGSVIITDAGTPISYPLNPTTTTTSTTTTTTTLLITQNVLFLGDSNVVTNTSDLTTKMNSIGYSISTITPQQLGVNYDGNNIASGSYSLIIMQTNGGDDGSSSLWANLKSFIDGGGHFIGQTFLWEIYPSGFDFTYTPFTGPVGQSYNGGPITVVTNHPVLGNSNVTNLPSTFVNPTTLQPGAISVLTYSDSMPLLGVKEIGSSRIVGINSFGGYTGDVGSLIGNAIVWCLGYNDVTTSTTTTTTTFLSTTYSYTLLCEHVDGSGNIYGWSNSSSACINEMYGLSFSVFSDSATFSSGINLYADTHGSSLNIFVHQDYPYQYYYYTDGNFSFNMSGFSVSDITSCLNTSTTTTTTTMNIGNTASGDYYIVDLYYPAFDWGDITLPDHTNTTGTLDPNLVGLVSGTTSVQLYINQFSSTGDDNSTLLNQLIGNNTNLTLTQGTNSVTYQCTNQAFQTSYFGPTSSVYFYDDQFGPSGPGGSPTGSITVITPSNAPFNTIDPVNIGITLI